MEEILILVVGWLLEFLAELLFYWPCDWLSRQFERDDRPKYFLWALAGAALGGISIALLPGSLLHNSGLRIANLVVAPVVSGFIAGAKEGKPDRAGNQWDSRERFWCAFWLTLGLVVIRFVAAKR